MKPIGMALLLAFVMSPCALAGQPKESQYRDFGALLSGKTIPLEMKLKDLDERWRRLSPGPDQTAGVAQIYGTMPTPMYTRGFTVTVAGETFLVAYRPKLKQMSMLFAVMTGRAEQPDALTPDTPVMLSLLNVRNLGSLNDIRPFNLEVELAEDEEMRQTLQSAASRVVTGEEGPEDNLEMLAMAVQMYLADNDDVLPSLDDLEAMRADLEEYVRSEEVFNDPETNQPYGMNASISGKTLAGIADPARMVVFYQPEPGADGKRGVAFLDGHVQRVGEAEWEELKAESNIP